MTRLHVGSLIGYCLALAVSAFWSYDNHNMVRVPIPLTAEQHQAERVIANISKIYFENKIMVNEGGVIFMATPKAAAMFGYKPSELQGQHITKIMPERWKNKHLSAFMEVLSRAKRGEKDPDTGMLETERPPRTIVCEGLSKDGTERKYEIRAALIPDTDLGFVSVATFTPIANFGSNPPVNAKGMQ